MADPVEIARGLSEAQRRAMSWPARSDPVMIWAYERTMICIDKLGLLKDRVGGWATLSPLGLAAAPSSSRKLLTAPSNSIF